MIVDGMVLRDEYIKRLDAHRDRKGVAKIVTGVRRCGKSVLMRQYIDHLKESGVNEEDIVYINMESSEFNTVDDFREFGDVLDDRIPPDSHAYVFIDEIQNVSGWEKNVSSMMADHDVDIYITGSNAYLLSSELATFISGRYVEVKMMPLSFAEYLELHPVDGDRTIDSRFNDYLRYGALPIVNPDKAAMQDTYDLLTGIYNTVLIKDVLNRLEIRSSSTLTRITKFLMSNIGNRTNTFTIAKELELSNATVEKYVTALEEALLIYKAERYDVRGKRILKSNGKYYASDTGIRNAVLGSAAGGDMGRQIENVVYLELRRRGYEVVVGSYIDLEVDFTAFLGDRVEYYQVTQTMLNEEVAEREAKSLRRVRDSFPKTILSLDRVMARPGDGIEHLNVIDWLLGERG
ncbi:MAG: ATP-binding protein [Candidatus Methanoplasma sp.]|nr:ATP-binding protein [Candidatus Methanoplasma sp.]